MPAIFSSGFHQFSIKIDTSSNKRWAETWLTQAQEYVEIEEWLLDHKRGVYDVGNFLADRWVGDIPWSDNDRRPGITRTGVIAAIKTDPRLPTIDAAFIKKFGRPLWQDDALDDDKVDALIKKESN